MTPQQILDKIVQLSQRHIYQIEQYASTPTKEGPARGFSETDSKILERYAKVMFTLTKPGTDGADEFDSMTDEELEAIRNGTDNVETSED